MTIGANVEVILSFIRMSFVGVLLVLFLIPATKGLFSAVKED